MFPVLVSLGFFQLRTLTIFSILAFFTMAFIFWRKGREEHYDEYQLFDSFLLSTFFGVLTGRVVFILFNASRFIQEPLSIFNIIGAPGLNVMAALAGAGIFLYRYAKNHKWDTYEVLDYWTLAISFGSFILWLGLFFDGTGFGYPTNLPLGVTFPTVFEPHHPVQLYFALGYFLLFWYLSWADFHYRTFSWYRGSKNTAQTGFLTSFFVIISGLISFILSFIRPSQVSLGGLALDIPLYAVITIAGVLLLFGRSGRSLRSSKPPRKPPALDRLQV
ncbi:MAG: prolipoprotein diacylglyceryl transferase [bacterium]|nr:prolipoprotein diacylglyceryl transferase [bacterium]